MTIFIYRPIHSIHFHIWCFWSAWHSAAFGICFCFGDAAKSAISKHVNTWISTRFAVYILHYTLILQALSSKRCWFGNIFGVFLFDVTIEIRKILHEIPSECVKFHKWIHSSFFFFFKKWTSRSMAHAKYHVFTQWGHRLCMLSTTSPKNKRRE